MNSRRISLFIKSRVYKYTLISIFPDERPGPSKLKYFASMKVDPLELLSGCYLVCFCHSSRIVPSIVLPSPIQMSVYIYMCMYNQKLLTKTRYRGSRFTTTLNSTSISETYRKRTNSKFPTKFAVDSTK